MGNSLTRWLSVFLSSSDFNKKHPPCLCVLTLQVVKVFMHGLSCNDIYDSEILGAVGWTNGVRITIARQLLAFFFMNEIFYLEEWEYSCKNCRVQTIDGCVRSDLIRPMISSFCWWCISSGAESSWNTVHFIHIWVCESSEKHLL